MNGKDKISVIIPCYNVQKYIMRCFDSIYSQTLVILSRSGSLTRNSFRMFSG